MPVISYKLTCKTCGVLADQVRHRAEAARLVAEHEKAHAARAWPRGAPDNNPAHRVRVERCEVIRS
jgi:hypothetical protein